MMTFSLDYALYSDVRWGYALTNMVIHWIAGLVFYFLFLRTLTQYHHKFPSVESPTLVAAAGALIWVVHPIQTQSVIYHVQRMESMMGLFLFASLLMCNLALGSRKASWIFWCGSAVFAYLSSCCKEVGYVTPILILLYAYVFNSIEARQHETDRPPVPSKNSYMMLSSLIVLIGSAIVFTLFWLSNSMGEADGSSRISKSIQYLMTQPMVILFYLRLAILPFGQSLDHAWPYADSLWEAILPGGLLLFLLALGVWYTYQKSPLGFCILSFFIILGPTSSFLPITDVAVEHRMYAPLAFVICMFILLFMKLVPNRTISLTVLAVAILGLLIVSHQRAQTYRSLRDLWTDVVQKNPQNPRGYFHLGVERVSQGDVDSAIDYFEEALTRFDAREVDIEYESMVSHDRTLFRLGNLYLMVNRIEDAHRTFLQFMQTEYRNAESFQEIGRAFAMKDRFDIATEYFEYAIEISENEGKVQTFAIYGQTALEHAKPELGLQILERGLELASANNIQNWQLHNNLGVAIVLNQGDSSRAKKHFQTAVQLSEGHADATANLDRLNSQ